MRAAWYSHNGEAKDVLVVGEMPLPEPGPGEVRVRLHTSGVNPSDVKSRRARPVVDPRIVPHSDGAGVIDAVGQGVPAHRLGERVWIWNGQWARPLGTASTDMALPSEQAVLLPEGVDFAAGACLGIPALTALQAVRLSGDLKDQTVLVTGASSAVGHYITQLVTLAGGHVIGTVGSPQKAAHAQAAGMQEAIFYKTEPVADRVKALTGGKGVSVIIDMDFASTSELVSAGALAAHGTVVCYGSNAPQVPVNFRAMLFGSIALKFFLVYDLTEQDRAWGLERLTALLKAGQLQHSIGPRFSLDQIVQAHETVEAGQSLGNVVVDLM
jgi:NADPH2:quinone reductase